MGYLYLIRNSVNAKVYVGITTKSIEDRWNQHVYNALNNLGNCAHLYNAIRKYDVSKFSTEMIAEYENYEELCQAEKDKIGELDSFRTGYNMTEGGEGASGYKHNEDHLEKMSKRMQGNQYGLGNQSKRGQKESAMTRKRKSSAQLGNGNHLGCKDSEIARQRKSIAAKPVLYIYSGKTQSLFQWKLELGLIISVNAIRERLRRGSSIEKIFSSVERHTSCQTS